MVSVKAGPPASTVEGEREESVGVPGVMVNVSVLDICPPGLVTPTATVPGAARRLAGTLAVSWEALTNVVASPLSPHCTRAPFWKLLPLTVRVKAAPPAAAELGLRLETPGVWKLPVSEVTHRPRPKVPAPSRPRLELTSRESTITVGSPVPKRAHVPGVEAAKTPTSVPM